ncbi:hypothetical protein N7931_05825 [Catenovulum sp. 2E275]|uniref:ABC transporter substrate binding protein n=1 Tax=Catenovulum sp. 2E275 TaxID=2980497 RepID=UPI0021CF0C26|nr:ABC transporter substrate binding protein [Catenovulum sp. 2E275]MCU4675148.1 hypothetical protein [Catenovulum sp. 2E275]
MNYLTFLPWVFTSYMFRVNLWLSLFKWFVIFISNTFLLFSLQLKADELTVVYPVVKPPYDEIFNQIRDGIAEGFPGQISELKLANKFETEFVKKQIKTHKVIALGKGGWIVAKQINQSKSVVVGALPIQPDELSGISLVASPKSLFSSLKSLAPTVKKIIVLYSSSSSWNVEQAKNDAIQMEYQLEAIRVNNIQEAVQAYDNLFSVTNLADTAIWLPLDPITANDKIIVPIILEKAWSHKVVVFSSKPNHARRGALFAAVPDNKFIGMELVNLLNQLDVQQKPIVKPMKVIKLAVNLRTAAHLGLNYSNKQKANFAFTFPE